MVTIIVAAARDGAIGKDGDLLWHLSGDLKRFKALTLGHTVVMGRKTWESLPKRPLSGRRNIVITRNAEYPTPGAEKASSLQEALDLARKEADSTDGEVFIIGGASVYSESRHMADALDFTLVDAQYPDADSWFDLPGADEWIVEEESEERRDEASGLNYRHIKYLRRKDACSDSK